MLWLREMIEPSSFGDAAKLRSLVDAAVRMAAAGDQGLAVNLLWRAGQRCFWGNPGQDARDRVLAAARNSRFPCLVGSSLSLAARSNAAAATPSPPRRRDRTASCSSSAATASSGPMVDAA
jgi:hypothetical protein